MAGAVLTQQTVSLQLPDLTGVADRVLAWALERCATRMGLEGAQAAAGHVRAGDAVARMHCCASIAQQVANSLGTADRKVRAIYAPDYDILFQDLCSEEGAGEASMVRLLVWTRRRTAELDALIVAWDLALARACREKIGAHELKPLLDVQVVEDRDVEKLLGYGQKDRMAARLAVYWMWSLHHVVDIVYEQAIA